ncbi:hypothetical protein [Methylibium petroleiphilum]|uniref:hypothetical protein n=1 Tax=Methylibium petroleiphilum TaxID=105560 RepID=UPI003D29D8B9
MKHLLTPLLLAAASAFAFAAEDHTPKHGGIVIETKAGDMELVAKPELIVIYISDHGKPMKLTSATGKVTLFNGNDKTEAPLALAGDKLEGKGNFKVNAGTKVLVDVALNGTPAVAARFTLK